jgi:hypothetical protein
MGLAAAAAGGGAAVPAAAAGVVEFNPDMMPKGVGRDMALQRVRLCSSSSSMHPLHA